MESSRDLWKLFFKLSQDLNNASVKEETMVSELTNQVESLKQKLEEKETQNIRALHEKDARLTEAIANHAEALKEKELQFNQALKEKEAKYTQALKDQDAKYTQALKDQDAKYTQALKDQDAKYTQALKDQEAKYTQALKDQDAKYTQAHKEEVAQYTQTLIDKETIIKAKEIQIDFAQQKEIKLLFELKESENIVEHLKATIAEKNQNNVDLEKRIKHMENNNLMLFNDVKDLIKTHREEKEKLLKDTSDKEEMLKFISKEFPVPTKEKRNAFREFLSEEENEDEGQDGATVNQ
ncbi:hypothetical protein CYY_000914 [Polysphondylium violaceum]|uniref:Uncharacterized protein n=1 Tax=Polysphondylium violaceum TaxID=133409 RepID=A0A8J4PZ00_9MYCE|nr:hypothetical protein CYY_000914 [Polysphondylium violaceum]